LISVNVGSIIDERWWFMAEMSNKESGIQWLKEIGDCYRDEFRGPQGEARAEVKKILDQINQAKISIKDSAAEIELEKIALEIKEFLDKRSPKDLDLTSPTLKDCLKDDDRSAADTLIGINNLYEKISENSFDLCESLCDYLLATSRKQAERYVARELMLRHCEVSGEESEQITSAIKLAECMAKLCESLTQQEFADMVLDVQQATNKPWLWLALLNNMVSGDIKKTNNEFLIPALAYNLERDPIKSHPDIQTRIAWLSHSGDENTQAILAGLKNETPEDNAAPADYYLQQLNIDNF
jgi:hypothetical protein